MAWANDAVRVRVPATSANLGPGFDALGLALSLHDDVDAWVCESGLSIEISGEGADLAGAGEEHLVVRAMRAAFAVTGGQPPGLGLRCVNRIPQGRGLGSSAAAIVAGILAARALAEPGRARTAGQLPAGAVLGLATELEGHPDNVAACLGGGLTIAWTADGQPRDGPARSAAVDQAGGVRGAGAGAHGGSQAPAARPGAAPGRGGQRRPQRPAGRRADATARRGRRRQRARCSPRPRTGCTRTTGRRRCRKRGALVGRLREAGIPAVVSGAGPSVLALLSGPEKSDYRHHLDRLGSIVRETGIAWHISSLDVERQGARILRPQSQVEY